MHIQFVRNIIIIIIILLRAFHTSFSRWFLKRGWLTASLFKSPGSSQYSCRSRKWNCLDIRYSSSYFQEVLSLYQTIWDCTKSTNYNCYYPHFYIPQFFLFEVLISLFMLFNFTLWLAETAKSTIWQVLFLVVIIIKSGRLAEIGWSICILKSRRSLCVVFSWTD